MLTLFVMLTLENFPNYMYQGMDVHPWSWIYFVSFILIAAFIVLNVLIGIVLNSMEEAREAERRKSVLDEHPERSGPVVDLDASAPVVERIALLRSALDELELELAAGSVTRPPCPLPSSRRERPRPAAHRVRAPRRLRGRASRARRNAAARRARRGRAAAVEPRPPSTRSSQWAGR